MIANLTVLTTFVAVMDERSVVAAARARGYSAAAVSKRMGWLQRRLGVRLFVPNGRSIRPTDREGWRCADAAVGGEAKPSVPRRKNVADSAAMITSAASPSPSPAPATAPFREPRRGC